ncbi:MAG: glycerophosphodiester phosphodiesterase family protein [Clostridia bacterium]|nr:glycerophosphodiester phosphodiesterase family protein [Clostridia bacterium]
MWLLDRPIAHRGLHDDKATENSMAAFRNAIEKNYYIEIDVRLLADGEIVVFHDGSLKRVCGKNAKIKNLTTADIKGGDYLLPNGETIPLLKELLELIEGKTKLLIELKTVAVFNHRLEQKVYELIKGKQDSVAVQSFSPAIISWFRKNAPEFTRGFLSTYIGNSLCNAFINLTGKKVLRKNKPDFLAFNIKQLPSKKLSSILEEKDIKLLSWTVRSEELLQKAKENDVDNIIFEKLMLENDSYN